MGAQNSDSPARTWTRFRSCSRVFAAVVRPWVASCIRGGRWNARRYGSHPREWLEYRLKKRCEPCLHSKSISPASDKPMKSSNKKAPPPRGRTRHKLDYALERDRQLEMFFSSRDTACRSRIVDPITSKDNTRADQTERSLEQTESVGR